MKFRVLGLAAMLFAVSCTTTKVQASPAPSPTTPAPTKEQPSTPTVFDTTKTKFITDRIVHFQLLINDHVISASATLPKDTFNLVSTSTRQEADRYVTSLINDPIFGTLIKGDGTSDNPYVIPQGYFTEITHTDEAGKRSKFVRGSDGMPTWIDL